MFENWVLVIQQKAIRRWVQLVIHLKQQHLGRLWCLEDAQFPLRTPKSAKKRPPPIILPEPLIQGWMDPSFLTVYAKFRPYHRNVTAESETHPTRHHFFKRLLRLFCLICLISSLSFLFLADRSGTQWSSAVVHLLQHSICCAFKDVLRHMLKVTSYK